MSSDKEKEEKEDGRLQTNGTELRIRPKEVRRRAKKWEKTILQGSPRPSAWSFDGRIEKVGNDYINVRSWGG